MDSLSLISNGERVSLMVLVVLLSFAAIVFLLSWLATYEELKFYRKYVISSGQSDKFERWREDRRV